MSKQSTKIRDTFLKPTAFDDYDVVVISQMYQEGDSIYDIAAVLSYRTKDIREYMEKNNYSIDKDGYPNENV